MFINWLLIILGVALVGGCFPLAKIAARRAKNSKRPDTDRSVLAVCLLFIAGLIVLGEAILYHRVHTSFFSLALAGSWAPLGLFAAGTLQGIAYEYIGYVALDLWCYPAVERHRKLFLAPPLAYGLFMFIMEDTFAIFRSWHLNTPAAFLLTATLQMALIEGINLYTKSWFYKGIFKPLLGLFLGWLLLTYTFVLGFNAYVLNPFGL